jgi:YcxB-like protein
VDIQVQVTPDPRRTLRGLRQLRRRRLWASRLYGAILILFGLLLLAVPSIAFAVVLVALGLVLVVLPDLALVRAVRRQARFAAGPTVIDINDERLRSANPMTTGEFAWSAVNRVAETDEFWFLRLVSRQTILLPKQHFTPEQQDALRGFLVGRGLVAAKRAG